MAAFVLLSLSRLSRTYEYRCKGVHKRFKWWKVFITNGSRSWMSDVAFRTASPIDGLSCFHYSAKLQNSAKFCKTLHLEFKTTFSILSTFSHDPAQNCMQALHFLVEQTCMFLLITWPTSATISTLAVQIGPALCFVVHSFERFHCASSRMILSGCDRLARGFGS